MSTQLSQQKEKERKIFDAFSKALKLPSIQQLCDGADPYPDGVLVLEDKRIAVEQTDYYYYKRDTTACNPVLDSILDKLSKALTQDGYRGCVGIELDQSDLFVDGRKIYGALKSIITDFINKKSPAAGSPIKLKNIHFCESKYADKLLVRRFACDTTPKFCRMITPEEATADPLKKKEEKRQNCKDHYDEHWIIVSIPWDEHIGLDDRNYAPIATNFDKLYIQEDEIGFKPILIKKPEKY